MFLGFVPEMTHGHIPPHAAPHRTPEQQHLFGNAAASAFRGFFIRIKQNICHNIRNNDPSQGIFGPYVRKHVVGGKHHPLLMNGEINHDKGKSRNSGVRATPYREVDRNNSFPFIINSGWFMIIVHGLF